VIAVERAAVAVVVLVASIILVGWTVQLYMNLFTAAVHMYMLYMFVEFSWCYICISVRSGERYTSDMNSITAAAECAVYTYLYSTLRWRST
jgi:hypothetical protein